MKSRSSRPGRTLFLTFLAASFVAILMAVPLVGALEKPRAWNMAQGERAPTPSASAGSSTPAPAAVPRRSFEECDRNHDGRLDKSESAAMPGLSAIFERVDANKDGWLDPAEFAKAIAQLEAGK